MAASTSSWNCSYAFVTELLCDGDRLLEPLLPTQVALVVRIIEECEAARLSELPRFHPSGSGVSKHLVEEGAKTEPFPTEAGTYPIV